MKKAFKLALYGAQKWKRLFIYLIPADMPRICGYSLSFFISCTAYLPLPLSLFVYLFPFPTTRIMRKSLIAIIRF